MKNERRNDKVHQQLNRHANYEAQQVIRDLHLLVRQPGRGGLSVGEMVKVAAKMGLLQATGKNSRDFN